MKKTKYIKYNRTRREEFQIRTCIVEEDGKQYVEKTALNEQAVSHIRSMKEKYDRLTDQSPLGVALVTLDQEGRTARFPFLKGETMAEILGRKIKEERVPVEELKKAMELVLEVREGFLRPFELTDEFTAVFGQYTKSDGETEAGAAGISAGESTVEQDEAFAASNVDCLFENIMVTEDGPCCLDYEWVFFFPIPVRFIRYRMLYYFYEQYRSLLGETTLPEFMVNFGIRPEMIPVYGEMEHHFQEYVHGENQKIYLTNYMHDVHIIPEDMNEVKRAVEKQREWVKQLHLEIEEKDLSIRKQIELKRLTDNHVTNLEVMIGNLRQDNENMA